MSIANYERCVKCKRCWDEDVFPEGEDEKAWACLTGNSTFSYGRMKRFKFIENYEFDMGYICNECLKGMKYEELNMINCDMCNMQYVHIFGTNDGFGCNADIKNNSIRIGYGSRFDYRSRDMMTDLDNMIKVKFVNGRPESLKIGWNICDNCVQHLIDTTVCHYPEQHI